MFRCLLIIGLWTSHLTSFGDCKSDWQKWITELTDENIIKLDNLGENELAEEFSGQYQGDIIISPKQLNFYKSRKLKGKGVDKKYRWIDAIVPYRINESYFGPGQAELIRTAMKSIENQTCIKFIPYNYKKHRDFISFVGHTYGCFSAVGRQGGEQIIHLQQHAMEEGCFKKWTIVHEILHALGFFHTSSARDRDDYIDVVWEKIPEKHKSFFDKYGSNIITNYEMEYDYNSTMHFSSNAFSSDGSATITTKLESPYKPAIMGQRKGMSRKDIEKLKRMYCERVFANKFENVLYNWFADLAKRLFR